MRVCAHTVLHTHATHHKHIHIDTRTDTDTRTKKAIPATEFSILFLYYKRSLFAKVIIFSGNGIDLLVSGFTEFNRHGDVKQTGK